MRRALGQVAIDTWDHEGINATADSACTREFDEPHCNKHKCKVLLLRVSRHIPGAAHLMAHTEPKCGSAVPQAVLSASMMYTNRQQPITRVTIRLLSLPGTLLNMAAWGKMYLLMGQLNR